MAVDIDVARIDPFDDIYNQWHKAAAHNAYDTVFSVGTLLPAAVALGVAAGLPVAVVRALPKGGVAQYLHDGDTAAQRIPVLDVTVDRVHRVTVTGVAVNADDPFTSRCHSRGTWTETTGTRHHIAAAADDPAGLTITTNDATPTDATSCEIPEKRGVVLRVGIDDRWCHARSLTVSVMPEPLTVTYLDHHH